VKKLHIVEEAEMDHLELEPLVNKGNVVINSNTKSSLCSNENAETFLKGASLEELQVPAMSSSTAATATPSSGGADHNAGHQPRIHLSRDDIAPLLALYFKQTHNFSIEGLPNSNEAPSAQSLQQNGQVAIPISCCFGCCSGSNETATKATLTATTMNSDLVLAIQEGSLDQVKQLLDVDGLNLNLREANGLTYLHVAVFKNQVDIAKYLLSKGAEVGVLGGEVKSTPLQVAAEKGYFEMVKLLMKHHREEESFTETPAKLFVQLKGEANKSHSSKAGTYNLQSTDVNGKKHWLAENGKHAIWYLAKGQSESARWRIGLKKNIGKDVGGLLSPDNTATPQEATTGGPPLVRSQLVRFPLVRIFVP